MNFKRISKQDLAVLIETYDLCVKVKSTIEDVIAGCDEVDILDENVELARQANLFINWCENKSNNKILYEN